MCNLVTYSLHTINLYKIAKEKTTQGSLPPSEVFLLHNCTAPLREQHARIASAPGGRKGRLLIFGKGTCPRLLILAKGAQDYKAWHAFHLYIDNINVQSCNIHNFISHASVLIDPITSHE